MTLITLVRHLWYEFCSPVLALFEF